MHVFLELRHTPAVLQDTLDLSTICDVQIIPGRTTFHINQCVFQVVEINDFYLIAKVLQSRNESYVRGNDYQFDDINEVKRTMLNRSRRSR